MATTLAPMAKKPESGSKRNDRHKPAKLVRIKPRLAAQAEVLAERLESDFTKVVNDAIREKLEREGLWPESAK